MNKLYRIIIVLILTCSLNVFPLMGYRDGTYTGESNGYIGPVKVKVKVESGKITRIKVTEHNENMPGNSLKVIPERIIRTNGVDGVDAVSGATMTSRAILNAAGIRQMKIYY